MRTVHPQRREAHPYDQIVRNAFTLITADVERTRWIVKAVLEVECAETYRQTGICISICHFSHSAITR